MHMKWWFSMLSFLVLLIISSVVCYFKVYPNKVFDLKIFLNIFVISSILICFILFLCFGDFSISILISDLTLKSFLLYLILSYFVSVVMLIGYKLLKRFHFSYHFEKLDFKICKKKKYFVSGIYFDKCVCNIDMR